MSPARISASLRQQVRERARQRCEYCLLAEEQSFFPHEPDHVIAEKHGGTATPENLAWACFDCNRFKGSNIASLDPMTGELVQLFNPRTQAWTEHFKLEGALIVALSSSARVTIEVLRLNLPKRVEVRETLLAIRRYPFSI